MSKKSFLAGLVVSLTLVAGMLSACGNETPTSAPANNPAATTVASATTAANGGNTIGKAGDVPSLSNATSVSVIPDALKAQAAAYTQSVPNGSFTAYKSSDAPDKVQSALSDAFTKGGWQDNSATMGQAAAAMKQQGIFVMFFQKGSKAAVAVGYPGKLAAPMGVTGVADSDTFYMVVSGGN